MRKPLHHLVTILQDIVASPHAGPQAHMATKQQKVQIVILRQSLVVELLGCPDHLHSLVFILYKVFRSGNLLGQRSLLPEHFRLKRPNGLIHEQ